MAKTTRESFKFMLRLPDDLRDGLRASAEVNNRTMTAEIIERLERSFVGFDDLKEANTPAGRVALARQRLKEALAALEFWEMLE